jgi:G patch domain-containing protein 1
VGSAEGFEPASFKSSRSERVSGAAGASKGARQQSIDDFLDEDELEERKRTHLQVKVWGAGGMKRQPPGLYALRPPGWIL